MATSIIIAFVVLIIIALVMNFFGNRIGDTAAKLVTGIAVGAAAWMQIAGTILVYTVLLKGLPVFAMIVALIITLLIMREISVRLVFRAFTLG
jgi:lipopolysaccharide export LptBFGC system permease protein LptF